MRRPTDAEAWERFALLYTPLICSWSRWAGLQDADAAAGSYARTRVLRFFRFSLDGKPELEMMRLTSGRVAADRTASRSLDRPAGSFRRIGALAASGSAIRRGLLARQMGDDPRRLVRQRRDRLGSPQPRAAGAGTPQGAMHQTGTRERFSAGASVTQHFGKPGSCVKLISSESGEGGIRTRGEV
jgi:hypothetical protein